MCVERLAVHRVGNKNFARMKTRINFPQRQHSLVAVGSGRDDVICQRFAMQLAAQRRTHFSQQIRERHTRICLVRIRMRILDSDSDVRHGLQVNQCDGDTRLAQ